MLQCTRRTRRAADIRRSPEGGFTLIEVIVSSLIVAIVVLGTFAGFDALGRASANQRHHDQATVIAAQSQEALRSDPAATLDELVNASTGHTYTQTVTGTKYVVTQTAAFQNGGAAAATCTAGGAHASESSYYIRVSSSVRWGELGKTRPAVVETSIITPPVGSALEVDITNGGKPATPVSGVTVISEGAETTTGENGCVIYNGIPATTTNIEAYKRGWVTKQSEPVFTAKEVSIAPNVVTHQAVEMAQGGSIKASFQYNNAATRSRQNNAKTGTVTETVVGDTFVAYSTGLTTPGIIAGSTRFEINSQGEYAPIPESYAASAKTPISATFYPSGNLFPFPSPWSVYAGDCTLNTPEKYGVAASSPTVIAGKEVSTTVPMSYVALNVYEKLTASATEYTKYTYPVKITNVSCTTPLASPANEAYEATYDPLYKASYVHTNTTNAEAHLTQPFQPFGKFSLCLYNSAAAKTYTATYTNSSVAGSTVNIFLGAAAGKYTEGTGTSTVETTVLTGQATNTC